MNGERTTRSKLQHLDVITFGRFADLVFVARAGEAAPEAPALRVRITWLNGPAAGQQVEVARGESILGRADSCNIIIDDASVSRAHARLTHSGGSVSIEDLGSANGIAVNEQQLSAAVALEPDDVVEIGDRRFKVLIDGEGRRPIVGGSRGHSDCRAGHGVDDEARVVGERPRSRSRRGRRRQASSGEERRRPTWEAGRAAGGATARRHARRGAASGGRGGAHGRECRDPAGHAVARRSASASRGRRGGPVAGDGDRDSGDTARA